jgi:acyl-CoA thioester hydrolase
MPFLHPIEVRFRDVDTLNHVNHAVIVSYLEAARYAWWREFLQGQPFQKEGFLIARVELDYRRPILLGEVVRIELRCPKVGRTSFDLAYRVLRGDGVVYAEGRTVQVMLDFASGRPVEIRAATRAWLEGQS